MTRTIALLTDFGTTDPYVGVMKGVMLGICPDIQFVDLTHAVQPQNIKQAAFLLLNSYRYFPAGTIFLAVVDPGVGSSRRAIAVQAGGYSFVAPDNGVLSYALRDIGYQYCVELSHPDFRSTGTSNTFHGRDIFAPAAAMLAMSSVVFAEFGDRIEQPVMLSEPNLLIEGKHITGEVLHLDHFGSAITSIGLLTWDTADSLVLKARFGKATSRTILARAAQIRVCDAVVDAIYHTYAEVGQGEPLALVGSSGYLELSVNGGNFAEKFGVKIGDTVELELGEAG